MWLGRTTVDSYGALASPAMTTWSGVSETLALGWGGGDGTVYVAYGMEQNGVISAAPLEPYSGSPPISTLERFAMVELEPGLLALSYTWTDSNLWYVPFVPFTTVLLSDTWDYSGTDQPIPPDIGGPALLVQGRSPFRLSIAGTTQGTQDVYFGFSLAPPTVNV